MRVIIDGDTGIDKITDGSVVADDLASTLDLSSKTVTLATDAAVVSKLSTASGSALNYSARAWVNFNGTGTVAIRASFNVSSITDNGTGDYTVNFTTAMPDANYCFSGFSNKTSATNRGAVILAIDVDETGTGNSPTTSALRVRTYGPSTSTAEAIALDCANISVAIFR